MMTKRILSLETLLAIRPLRLNDHLRMLANRHCEQRLVPLTTSYRAFSNNS